MARISYGLILPLSLVLMLTACGSSPPAPEELPTDGLVTESSSSSSEAPRPATYQGQVQEAGISIYQEGTHRLVLNDGSFVLLEGDGLDLDTYLGQEVEVSGLERSTVEAGGLIVQVQNVTPLNASSASSSSDESVSSTASVRSAVPASVSSAPAVEPVAASSAAANPMVKYKVDGSTMTQQYCSSHAGFCIPVHKNGYWNAFGATGRALWHVEVGSAEITELGQGPLVVDVISGTLSDAGASDGQVTTQGDQAVGYRAFGESKYIMVSAPAELQQLVSYTTRNVTLSAPASSAASQAVSQ